MRCHRHLLRFSFLVTCTLALGAAGIASGLALIALPSRRGTVLALAAGLHVMIEKPISAHKADAERLIAAAQQRPRQVFAGMFQLRTEPRYLKIQKLIRDGPADLVYNPHSHSWGL